jgi:hypothetical protein
MKKLTLLICMLTVACVFAHAQEYKKFKVGLGVGYASASGSGASGGLLWYMEPAYRISDQLLVGLRIEGAVITRGASDDLGDLELDIAGISSYTINGQYYFNNNSFRPFVGLGIGMFSMAAVKIDASASAAAAAETKFGLYPRVGFDYGHFNMSFDYNLIPATTIEDSDL